eukprot:2788568-Prymnesium_polylepis.1
MLRWPPRPRAAVKCLLRLRTAQHAQCSCVWCAVRHWTLRARDAPLDGRDGGVAQRAPRAWRAPHLSSTR